MRGYLFQRLATYIIISSYAVPAFIVASLAYPLSQTNGQIFYRCINEFDKVFDFQSGNIFKLRWRHNTSFQGMVARTAFYVLSSNLGEAFFLGASLLKIKTQTDSIADVLSPTSYRNRKK